MKFKTVSASMKQTILIPLFLFICFFQAIGADVRFSFLRVDFPSDDPAMRKQGFCLTNQNERDTKDCYHWSVRINGKKVFTINDHYILGNSINKERYFSFDDASANEIENTGLDLVSPIRHWNGSAQSMGSEPDRKAELMKLLEPYLPNMPEDVVRELREPGFGDGKGILYANVELLNPADEVVDRILITSLPIGVPRSYAVYYGKNEKAGFRFISNIGTGPEKIDPTPVSLFRVDHAEFDAEKGVFAIVHDVDVLPLKEVPLPTYMPGVEFELFRNPADADPYVILKGKKFKMDSLDGKTMEKLKTLAAENEGKEIRYRLRVLLQFQPPAFELEGACVLKTGPLSKPTPRLWRDPYPVTKEQKDQIIQYVKEARVDLLEEACEGKDVDFNRIFDESGWSLLANALDHDLKASWNTLTPEDIDRTLEFLLNHHANPQILNRSGYHAATRVLALPYSSLELLLKYGLDPSYTDPDGETMLDKAIEFRAEKRNVDPKMIEALERLCSKNLWSAVKVDDAETLRARLDDASERANINAFDRKGHSPLFYAIRRGDLEIMRILIDAGADPKRTVFEHGKNQTALLEYQQDIEPALAEYLKSPVKGVTVTRKKTSVFGTEPSGLENYQEYQLTTQLNGRFIKAVKAENLTAMKQCIKEGVDVNEAGGESFYAIQYAVQKNNPEMVRLLLENGVSAHNGRKLADKYKFLLANAISCEESSSSNWRKRSAYEVTRLLLDAGFSTELPTGSTVDKREGTCLFMALNREMYDLAELLLQYGAKTDISYLEEVPLAEQLAEVPAKSIAYAGGIAKGILMMPLGFLATAIGNDINPPLRHIPLENEFKNDKKAVELLKKFKTSGK